MGPALTKAANRVTIRGMSEPVLRIVSLLPAATEIVWALGLGDRLVGRSHECDWPSEVASLPCLTRSTIAPEESSGEIHAAVERALASVPEVANPLFTLDVDALADLQPDLILTQATCAVCAIADEDVGRAVRTAGRPVRVVALSANSLAGLWQDVHTVGAATAALPQARAVVSRLQARCQSVACRVKSLERPSTVRPRVAVIEWLDPPMAAGNWVPELVTLAGGIDCLGHSGRDSHWIDWHTVAATDPDVVVLSPCGLTLERIIAEAETPHVRPHLASLRAARAGHLWAMDGHHLLNRPGPRLVDSLEVLAGLLNPGRFSFGDVGGQAARVFAAEQPRPHDG